MDFNPVYLTREDLIRGMDEADTFYNLQMLRMGAPWLTPAVAPGQGGTYELSYNVRTLEPYLKRVQYPSGYQVASVTLDEAYFEERGGYAEFDLPDHTHIGAWIDPDTGELLIELSLYFPHTWLEEAMDYAREQNQKAIWDWEKGTEIWL